MIEKLKELTASAKNVFQNIIENEKVKKYVIPALKSTGALALVVAFSIALPILTFFITKKVLEWLSFDKQFKYSNFDSPNEDRVVRFEVKHTDGSKVKHYTNREKPITLNGKPQVPFFGKGHTLTPPKDSKATPPGWAKDVENACEAYDRVRKEEQEKIQFEYRKELEASQEKFKQAQEKYKKGLENQSSSGKVSGHKSVEEMIEIIRKRQEKGNQPSLSK